VVLVEVGKALVAHLHRVQWESVTVAAERLNRWGASRRATSKLLQDERSSDTSAANGNGEYNDDEGASTQHGESGNRKKVKWDDAGQDDLSERWSGGSGQRILSSPSISRKTRWTVSSLTIRRSENVRHSEESESESASYNVGMFQWPPSPRSTPPPPPQLEMCNATPRPRLSRAVCLWYYKANHGAAEVVDELRSHLAERLQSPDQIQSVCTEAECGQATHRLLVLRADTFEKEAGKALAAEVLAHTIGDLWGQSINRSIRGGPQGFDGNERHGIPTVIIHSREPGAGSFHDVMINTPLELRETGMYEELAIPWHTGPFRTVAIDMLVRVLESHNRQERSAWLAAWRAVDELVRAAGRQCAKWVDRCWSRRVRAVDIDIEDSGLSLTDKSAVSIAFEDAS